MCVVCGKIQGTKKKEINTVTAAFLNERRQVWKCAKILSIVERIDRGARRYAGTAAGKVFLSHNVPSRAIF